MKIYEALVRDHEAVKELLEELVALDKDDTESRNDLVMNIRDELIPHSRAEESVFYNSLRALDANIDKVWHGYQEHLEAETLLRALQIEDKINVEWKATAKKLKAALEHHIKEEEGAIFKAARKVISDDEANVLGELFEGIKPQIKEEGFLKTSLDAMFNMLPPRLSTALKKFGMEKKAA